MSLKEICFILPIIIWFVRIVSVEFVKNENLSVLLEDLGNPFDRLPIFTRSCVKEALSFLLDELFESNVHQILDLMKFNICWGRGLLPVAKRVCLTHSTMALRAMVNSAVLLKLLVKPYCFTNSATGRRSMEPPVRSKRRVAPMIWSILSS